MDQETLFGILEYHHETGYFFWKESRGRVKAGCMASTARSDGYHSIQINGKKYLAHRLVWLYLTGSFPSSQIDHLNGDRSDNRFCNLREATNAQNTQNKASDKGSSSRYVGVNWCKRTSKWLSRIMIGGKSFHLGHFMEEESAANAYRVAKNRLHDFQPTARESEC